MLTNMIGKYSNRMFLCQANNSDMYKNRHGRPVDNTPLPTLSFKKTNKQKTFHVTHGVE